MKKILIGLGVVFGLFLLVIVGGLCYIGMRVTAGYYPDTKVIVGAEIKQPTRDAIVKIIPLNPGETIEFFYGAGFASFEEDGNLITNQRVVSYYEDEDRIDVSELKYEDIKEFYVTYSEDWLEDSEVYLYDSDDNEVFLLLSNEEGVDRIAVEYIRQRTNIEPEVE